MTAPAPEPTTGLHAGEAIFSHVLVGIDETPESLVAAAQAGLLRAKGGQLVLLAVAETYLAAHAGFAASGAGDRVVAGASTDLERAKELVDADDAVLAEGRLVPMLCAECSRRGATLIAVGVRPHRRLPAVTFGGHDVEALHDARCSVLIARPGWGPSKPDRIVVGVDGSSEARTAEAVARTLAARVGCEVVPVVALGGDVDLAVLRAERDDALLDTGRLTDALVRASSERSLIVVGRGPERPRWGGRVAERIVYSARCSVLVVQHEPAAVA